MIAEVVLFDRLGDARASPSGILIEMQIKAAITKISFVQIMSKVTEVNESMVHTHVFIAIKMA